MTSMPQDLRSPMSTGQRPVSSPRAPESIKRLVLRWVTRATVAGTALSVVVHLILMIVGGLVHVGGGSLGVGGKSGPDGPVEVAYMSGVELAALGEAQLDATTPAIDVGTATDGIQVDIADAAGGAGMPDVGDLGAVGEGLGGAGTGLGIGVGSGAGGSGGGTSFFGVEARGDRFAYIVDISGSMEGSKLGTLKSELISSLDKLNAASHFMVFFFESQSFAIFSRNDSGRDKWIPAGPKEKERAEREIRGVESRGGTYPAPAFVRAFALTPRPDAIYFMTDGLFDPEVADRVARMNSQGKAIPVHCIAFGDRSSEATMRRIADTSGGTYTFIAEPRR